MIGRIVIENIRPSTPGGDFPAKTVAGEPAAVAADIYREGHDLLAALVKWRSEGSDWRHAAMTVGRADRWWATIEPVDLGLHEFVIEAWTDSYSSWVVEMKLKHGAGQDVALELEEGAQIVQGRMPHADREDKALLSDALAKVRNLSLPIEARVATLTDEGIAAVFGRIPERSDLSVSPVFKLWVDRERARTGAWYELFPRSEGGLQGVTKRIESVAEMGFDILYLAPIHPIGVAHRKGRDNSLEAGPNDPGSPWAIGSDEGGHTAINPQLGTFEDFDRLVEKAGILGMEIAMDYALQCSADHPWLKEHPEWFNHRPDGTIMYAENPPKKYQDIYPLKLFPMEEQMPLWEACRQILDFWIGHGIKIFRVDNPHTKPLPFWQWLINAIHSAHPDVIFLAEAFTQPRMMAKLAEVGFSQTYTYFTWRVAKQELTDYITSVTTGRTSDYMRPSLWPNTPDILSGPLIHGSPAAFKQRLVLASTMSPSYGIYNGYELCENEPASPDAEAGEDYLHSEKYEIKKRDWNATGNLTAYITRVNETRAKHPSLRRLTNIKFHETDSAQVLAYSKRAGDDVVLVVVNLDPKEIQEASVQLNLEELGLAGGVKAFDELAGPGDWVTWEGSRATVKLDPEVNPASIFWLRAAP
ncbi:MAG: maltotransferase domain-containing protein [Actinomycetota bacterium]